MKRAFSMSAIAITALLLVGCSANGSMDSSSVSRVDGAPAPVIGLQSGGGAESADMAVVPGAVSDRAVITTGTVSVTSADPIGSAADAIKLVNGAGGRVDSRSEQPATGTQRASASLVIRVPADQLDSVLDKITMLGTVNAVSLNASDVTQQKQDIEARITALQTSVDRLLDLLANATDTADLITIESALSSRQAELDSLTTQRDYLDDQIDYSTISVDFFSEGTVEPGSPDSFWDGLVAGWNGLLAFLGGFVVVLGVLLPWLVLFAIIAAIVVAIVLSSRRRSRRRAAERAAGEPERLVSPGLGAQGAAAQPPLHSAPHATPPAAGPDEDVQQ